MRVLLFGGTTGMLAQALGGVFTENTIDYIPIGRKDCDIFSQESVYNIIKKYSPTHIINTIAWTQVDDAEEHTEEAYLVNTMFPEYIARVAVELGIDVLHYSTDFVFYGNSVLPYTEEAIPNPRSVYGHTKWEGERKILNILPTAYVIRTSWLFGLGRENFVSKVLEILQKYGTMRVIADQFGVPTSTADLAKASLSFLYEDMQYGTYHVSNAGEASWYSLAHYVAECYAECTGNNYTIIPIRSEEYPQKAYRPRYSVMDIHHFEKESGWKMPHWRIAVQEYIQTLF